MLRGAVSEVGPVGGDQTWTRSWGGVPTRGLLCLSKGGESTAPLPSEDMPSVSQAVSRASPDTECAGTPTLDLSASRTVRHEAVSFKPRLGGFCSVTPC